MRSIYLWLTDLARVVRDIARAVAYSRTHPTELPKHEDK